MRQLLQNLFTLQPQNLIPEAIWLGVVVYALLLLACLHSVLFFHGLRRRSKLTWILITLLPFIGPVIYSAFRLITADSTLRELLASQSSRAN